MRILVACEWSGVVRDALLDRGHFALSCDLEPTGIPGPHYQGDVRDVLYGGWDMMIAFPPCDHLAASGAPWWMRKRADGRQQVAVAFFMQLATAPIPKIAIENPVGVMSRMWRSPDQTVEPFEFGDPWRKRTQLWLKGLPPLKPTDVVEPVNGSWVDSGTVRGRHRNPKHRGTTFPGIARAMAEQWT